jgi:5-(carboxyamino)imidazole ribonucleotide synthase
MIEVGDIEFPFVQKARTGGYDGRGVAVIKDSGQLHKALDTGSIIEPLVDIEKEISVIVVRNENGEVKTFPPVAMEFHPEANLVEYLYSPSGIGPALEMEAIQIAQSAIEAFDLCGLLAVEMFVTKSGQILINEVAPRPHNSGHHTIESCSISQYQMGLLSICNLSLPDIKENVPAVMVNILGAEGYTGPVRYEGVEKALSADNVFLHLYGKKVTKPFRKMGHATVLDTDLSKAIEKATFVKDTIKVIS